MKITIKTQYGIKSLIDIAFHDKAGPVQRKSIALRQGIPTDYMDHILLRLKQSGLVHSFRGREGGYHLALDPKEISVWDIVQAVEEPEEFGDDRGSIPADMTYAKEFLTNPALSFIQETITRQLKKYTLEMFLDDADDRMLEKGIDPVQLLDSISEHERHLNRLSHHGSDKHHHKINVPEHARVGAVLATGKTPPLNIKSRHFVTM